MFSELTHDGSEFVATSSPTAELREAIESEADVLSALQADYEYDHEGQMSYL